MTDHLVDEIPLTHKQVEDLAGQAAELVADDACKLLAKWEAVAREQHGDGTECEGVFKAAAIGALIGVGQGQIVGSGEGPTMLCGSVAKIVAINIMKLRSEAGELDADEVIATAASMEKETRQ